MLELYCNRLSKESAVQRDVREGVKGNVGVEVREVRDARWNRVSPDNKMAAFQHKFAKMGMLVGTTASYMAQMKAEDEDVIAEEDEFYDNEDDDEALTRICQF